jgi:hypothetical protein
MTKARKVMNEVLTIVLVLAGWILLTQVVLPKLGVPT